MRVSTVGATLLAIIFITACGELAPNESAPETQVNVQVIPGQNWIGGYRIAQVEPPLDHDAGPERFMCDGVWDQWKSQVGRYTVSDQLVCVERERGPSFCREFRASPSSGMLLAVHTTTGGPEPLGTNVRYRILEGSGCPHH